MSFNPLLIREDFPIFSRTIREGKRLVYLDSGATSQKPQVVIDAEVDFYRLHNAAVHRGAHQLAEEATDLFEGARSKIARFLGNAASGNRFHLKAGDRIVVSQMEHHANLIPWQQLAARTGAELVWFDVTPEGRLDLSQIPTLITASTKVVALTHQSNVLGTINPLDEIVKAAHNVGAVVVLDACQSVPHMSVDVKKLGIDFLAFSGHKAVGPTGVGIMWGRRELLEELPPFLTGGSMIADVTMTSATWAPAPAKFESGVPNMAQVIGLGVAVDYLSAIGMDSIAAHEHVLSSDLLTKLLSVEEIKVVGPHTMDSRGGALSFTVEGIHPHDLGQFLDSQGIAVRTGHHCAWPLTRFLGVPATTRASLYLYNTIEDNDALMTGIHSAMKYFGK
jgi:cysteine desulfurase/selenocysteine lyase